MSVCSMVRILDWIMDQHGLKKYIEIELKTLTENEDTCKTVIINHITEKQLEYILKISQLPNEILIP